MAHEHDDLERYLAGRPLALRDRATVQALQARGRVGQAGTGDVSSAPLRAGSLQPTDVLNSGRVVIFGAVAVVRLEGMVTADPVLARWIGGTSPEDLVADLDTAVHTASTTLLVVDSPGGEVGLVPEAAAEIFRLGRSFPMQAFVRGEAGSAAYWLASQAPELVATPSGEAGSIGVFGVHVDRTGAYAQAGLSLEYIHAGRHKVEMRDSAPLADDARAHLQAGVDAVYAAFVRDVARGRRVSEAVVRGERFGQGRMFGATEALARGLVDRVEPLAATLTRLGATSPARSGFRAAAATSGRPAQPWEAEAALRAAIEAE